MRLLLLAFGCLLLLGCAGTAEPPPQDVAPPPDVTMTCEEYCPTLPHIECVGQWNISGTYPDCVCSFECEVEEVTEDEQPADETAEQEPPPEPEIPTTDKNVSELLDDGVEKLRMDFYSDQTGGSFQERHYKWKRVEESVSPGEIIFDSPSFVRFEGVVIESLHASGLVLFENTDSGETDAYGVAIFKDTGTLLDDVAFFNADYPSPVISKELRDCWVYEKEHKKNLQGEDLLTYYFHCLTIRSM